MSPSLHVAIATLGYPPIRHVSGTRPGAIARELVRMGHRVTVVTIDWRPGGGRSASEEDGVHVVRIDPREWFPDFDPDRRPLKLEYDLPLAAIRRVRTAWRTLRWGPFAPWAIRASAALLKHHRDIPVDATWAIHGDDSAHEIAFRFHRATGVPWIADFKDPWDQFHPRALRSFQRVVTSRRLVSSFCMTHNGEAQARLDERVFGKASHVIWTSYDHELLARVQPRRVGDAFSILYIGHLGTKHDRSALAATLQRVRARAAGRRVEFHVFGHETESLRRYLDAEGVGDLLVQHSFVAQADAYAYMRGADVLLLLPTSNHRMGVAVGVKELEYFASGSPVVAVGSLLPEMRAVVRDLASVSECVTPDAAADAIIEELDRFARGEASVRRGCVNPPPLMAHTWPEKARALERVVRAAVETRTAPQRGTYGPAGAL